MKEINLCRRCGTCCHIGFRFNVKENFVAFPYFRCKYLKKEGDLYCCDVYDSRFEVAPWCVDSFSAQKKNALSPDCPYVSHLSDYKGKRLLKGSILRRFLPYVYEIFIKNGVPDFVSQKECYKFLIDWEIYRKNFFSLLEIKKLYKIIHDKKLKMYFLKKSEKRTFIH